MQFKALKHVRRVFALVLVAGYVALTLSLSPGAAPVSAVSPFSGELHVTKECSEYTGQAGSFCTITYSNLDAIAVGSKVTYARAVDWDALQLNTNIVLDDGAGNTAVGHCRLSLVTWTGQCTFSGGTGTLTGLHARVAVSPLGWPNFAWHGTYFFSPPN